MSVIATKNKHILNQCLEKTAELKKLSPDCKKVESKNPGSITIAGCVNANTQLNYLPITHYLV